jgi:hypothetical protein
MEIIQLTANKTLLSADRGYSNNKRHVAMVFIKYTVTNTALGNEPAAHANGQVVLTVKDFKTITGFNVQAWTITAPNVGELHDDLVKVEITNGNVMTITGSAGNKLLVDTVLHIQVFGY